MICTDKCVSRIFSPVLAGLGSTRFRLPVKYSTDLGGRSISNTLPFRWSIVAVEIIFVCGYCTFRTYD